MKKVILLLSILLHAATGSAQEGRLIRTEIFTIPTEKVEGPSGYSFKIAADSKENIAFNACSRPYVYIFSATGVQTDSIKLPNDKCVRALEFDEYDNLLIMDNNEQSIYRYNFKYKKLETLPYSKPEDWFTQLNHYYKHFELPSIPTYYSNNDYLQDFYFTRFTYSYNLYLNYNNGFIYQAHYNYIKKINNHKTYANMKKEDIWLSDNLTPKSKILLVNDANKAVVYYDRFYNLIYENTSQNKVVVNAALEANSEPARFDYCTNIKQEKIFGISGFNKRSITISSWKL
ncbi:MAG: hypothetical protein IPP46_17500 [Bacteroidetes bacterium]|nr:hypothetical protein [Bacteroidota bacterium]